MCVYVSYAMGAMSHSVSIGAPAGWPGLTPQVGLSHSSSSGSGLLGIGWSMDMPSVERVMMYRLPEYKATDDFVVGGGDLLVLSGEVKGTPMYRSHTSRASVVQAGRPSFRQGVSCLSRRQSSPCRHRQRPEPRRHRSCPIPWGKPQRRKTDT
jgi:hypothetical protein